MVVLLLMTTQRSLEALDHRHDLPQNAVDCLSSTIVDLFT
jgi:hypothetical protein